MSNLAAISCDVDTLESIYHGRGCRRPEGYSSAEFRIGLENLAHFLEPYGIQATLFMVGNDFAHKQNRSAIQAVAGRGHEIANHTMTHAQGFRALNAAEKEAEIGGMEQSCENTIGTRPVGFRSPGWNMSDDGLAILKRRGYLYDASIHPTSLMPLLKVMHWVSTRACPAIDRTTMGQISYLWAPKEPYVTSVDHLGKKGKDGLVEFPMTVLPFVRLPFWATFLLATGFEFFKKSYQLIRSQGMAIQYSFHLSDFVDYAHPELIDQVPKPGDGVYVPASLRMSLEKKVTLFHRALDLMACDYRFDTLHEWAIHMQSPLGWDGNDTAPKTLPG
jgi:peptidoglycan-N-acetylglucosamine deacetylase